VNVVITDYDLPRDGRIDGVLRDAGHTVRIEDCRTEADVLACVDGADALIVQWAPITDRVLAAASSLRFVSRLGIGYDMIDVEAAARRGITVANTPDYCIDEVATHTVALALHGMRSIGDLDRAVRAGRWSPVADGPDAIRPSSAQALVVGFGRIGRRVAGMLAALGFRVLVHDPHVPDAVVATAGARPSPLEAGLAAAQLVCLHAPLTPATHHLLDAQALARCRPEAWIVNTCRGGLIDEDALAVALLEGRLRGAALDVFEREPLPADSPLRTAPNVVLTPHAAWYSRAALADLPIRAAENVIAFLAGQSVPTVVNHAMPPQGVTADRLPGCAEA
jgi:D-3-phosphoglycerate dehydrogenase